MRIFIDFIWIMLNHNKVYIPHRNYLFMEFKGTGSLPYEISVHAISLPDLLKGFSASSIEGVDEAISQKDIVYHFHTDPRGFKRVNQNARILLTMPLVDGVRVTKYIFRRGDSLEIELENGEGHDPGAFGSVNFSFPQFHVSVRESPEGYSRGEVVIREVEKVFREFYEAHYSNCRRCDPLDHLQRLRPSPET